MGENSKISWTDHTFNPWIGCTKVSPGCDNCYAETQDGHRKWTAEGWGTGKPRTRTTASWKNPLKWNKEAELAGVRRKVFCASLADVFDNAIPQEWRHDLFNLIKATPHLDWLLLTKRIGNAKKMLPADWGKGYPNVWLLITVVNQKEAIRDIPKLLFRPAVIRGLSIEPQIEGINLCPSMNHGIDWVICGAESGPKRRPFNEDWARSLRNQCQQIGAAFFYKQIIKDGKKLETPELDGRQWAEFPTSSSATLDKTEDEKAISE